MELNVVGTKIALHLFKKKQSWKACQTKHISVKQVIYCTVVFVTMAYVLIKMVHILIKIIMSYQLIELHCIYNLKMFEVQTRDMHYPNAPSPDNRFISVYILN